VPLPDAWSYVSPAEPEHTYLRGSSQGVYLRGSPRRVAAPGIPPNGGEGPDWERLDHRPALRIDPPGALIHSLIDLNSLALSLFFDPECQRLGARAGTASASRILGGR
jgi:hypothetical protein